MSGPLLDLKTAKRIWVGQTEARELWVGGAHWVRPTTGPVRDTFTGPDGTGLASYVGESGMGWPGGSKATIRGGILRPATASTHQLQTRADVLGADQFAQGTVVVGTAVTANSNSCVGLAVRADAATNNGYIAWFTQTRWYLARCTNAAATLLSPGRFDKTYAAGTLIDARLEAQGSTIRLLLDGVAVLTATDTTYTSGSAGIRALATDTTGQYAGLTDFTCGNL